MSTINKQFLAASDLARLIKYHESRDNYNIVYGGIKEADKPWKPLTEMTIREVLQWQESIKGKSFSTAAGAWQIINKTLRGNYRPAGLSLEDKFSSENQDKIALRLMKYRGLDDYLAGEIDIYEFGNNIAKEWASMPVVKETQRKGKPVEVGASYYSDDGVNKAHASVEEMMSALSKLKEAPPEKEPRKKVMQTKTAKAGAAVVAVNAVPEIIPEDLDLNALVAQVESLSGVVDTLQSYSNFQLVLSLILGGYIIYNRYIDMKEGRK